MICNQFGKSLDVQYFANIEVSITYINSHLFPHIPLIWVKDIKNKEIEFDNDITSKDDQKFDFSL